jgi:hypothetical protein
VQEGGRKEEKKYARTDKLKQWDKRQEYEREKGTSRVRKLF